MAKILDQRILRSILTMINLWNDVGGYHELITSALEFTMQMSKPRDHSKIMHWKRDSWLIDIVGLTSGSIPLDIESRLTSRPDLLTYLLSCVLWRYWIWKNTYSELNNYRMEATVSNGIRGNRENRHNYGHSRSVSQSARLFMIMYVNDRHSTLITHILDSTKSILFSYCFTRSIIIICKTEF